MTLRSSDFQSDGDLDSIRNSCDVSLHNPEARACCQESDNRFLTATWMASYKVAAIQELGGLVINPELRGCPK